MKLVSELLCRATLLACLPLASAQEQQGEGLTVGHWVSVKGELDGRGEFVASAVEVLDPADEEVLIGMVEKVERSEARFRLLGRPVYVSEKTEWRKLDWTTLAGARVKVEGHHRGPQRFSSRAISTRGAGRDQLVGRLDHLERTAKGLTGAVMDFLIRVPGTVAVESEKPLDQYSLAAPRAEREVLVRVRDEDDFIPGTYELAENLYLGARLELGGAYEQDRDLDEESEQDDTIGEVRLRGEMTWRPTERFFGLLGVTLGALYEDEETDGSRFEQTARVPELFGYWYDVGVEGLDFQIGRQDFDERREWLWDENLDAVRVWYRHPAFRVEVSASTVFWDSSERNEESSNFIAYVTNNNPDKVVGAYVVDRRGTYVYDPRDGDRATDNYPIHFGARAFGEWIPGTDSWLEISSLRGYREFSDLDGFGFDVGSTIKPAAIEPYYVNVGFAFGSGDDDPFDGVDETFRQTGFQDNNDKLGGVTSFRYYGELLDPELSNLEIWTLGAGRRFGRALSLDLLFHDYRQDVAADRLIETALRKAPNGLSADLGWEVDLVLGVRFWKGWDFEAIVSRFEPGAAFDDPDPSWLVTGRLRMRL